MKASKCNFIMVSNPTKLEEIKSAGFSTYMTEKQNGQDVFVFAKTPELIEYLNSRFEKGDFFYTNKLHF